MNIAGFIEESLNDGEGIRSVIFISGCKHNCYNCQNIQSHNFNYGKSFTKDMQLQIINKIKNNPLIDGITLSGGDPFYSSEELNKFIILLKQNIEEINIWIYTGFTYEEILNSKNQNMIKLLTSCNVLVDGKYIEKKKNLRLKFRGSENQRIIDIQQSLKGNKVVKYKGGYFE